MVHSVPQVKQGVPKMNFRLEFATAMCAIAVVSSVAAQQVGQPTLTGTCASIGYSTACCPPGARCQASDGNCNCGSDCHVFGDCCRDIYCPAQPRTCRDVGILSCCSDTVAGTGNCDVHISATERCSCNRTCHERGDCCSDAEAIGCVPQTCAQAGKGAGCCSLSSSSSCYVSGGDCYCDISCVAFDDCCEDVPVPQCPAANGNARRSRVPPNIAQENSMPSYAHPFKARPYSRSQNAYIDRYAHQREALATRAQRIRAAMEYRARARTTVRRPSA